MLNALKMLNGFLLRREKTIAKRIRPKQRLKFESLETRRVLSTNAPDAIMGNVFADLNANNTFDAGEEVEGAIVRLYLDNGDGIFDPNNGDIQIGADAVSDVNGVYCFTELDQSATYFVRQIQQTVDGINLQQQDSAAITFTPQLLIDEFATTQITSADPPPPSDDDSSLTFPDETEVIGAERDLAVALTGGMSEIQLRVNPFNQQDVLLFDSSAGTTGTRVITWDGQDNDGVTLALGLNGRDLTAGGALTGFTMLTGVDANGGNMAIRIYQGNTTTPSEAVIPIPQTDGTATEWVNIPFSSLVGPVSPDNVDAIQLELLTGASSVDGQIDIIGTAGAQTADFDNDVSIDLELEKTVDATTVNAGQEITWTLTLTNNDSTATPGDGSATAAATGVVVSDVLPVGVSFVSSDATNGSFSNGVWTLATGIAPGTQETLTLVTTVNSGLAGGTTITNIAEVTSHDQPDIDSVPNNDDGDQSEDDEDAAQVTVVDAIDLEITKTASTTDVQPGEQITFTITIVNNAATANTAATGVQVADTLPTGMTLVSGTPSGNGTFDDQTSVWSLVDPLMPGVQQTLTILANVENSVQGNSQLTNVAEVIAANEMDVDSIPNNDDGDQSEDDEDTADFTVGAVVDLELTKSANVQAVNPGEAITWTLNVTNNAANANAPATNVEVTDVIPTGTTLTMATPSGNGQFSNGVWSLVDPLPPGSVATLTLMTTVDSGVPAGTLTNTAQVTSVTETDFDSAPNNDDGDQSEDDESAASVTLNSQIDLELSKTVDQAAIQAGGQATWTVTVTNNADNANASATGVTITDVVPAGLINVTATPSDGTFANDVWTLANPLAPGASATLTITSTVDPATTQTSIANVAEISTANETDVDSTPGNDTGNQSEDDEDVARITVTPNVIDLELTKSVNQSAVQVGGQAIWTVTVTNNADNANTSATGVTITDVVPAGLINVTATPSDGTFANDVWTLANPLAPGASATLSITSTVDPATTLTAITNVAEVSTANEMDVDSTPGNDNGAQSEDDEDNARITVTPNLIDLELTKSVNQSAVQAGGQVIWTVAVTNNADNANASATGVTITDVVPAGLINVTGAPSDGTFANNVWTLANPLAPGASATLTLTSTVDPTTTLTSITNVAEVTSANEMDVDSTPGNDTGTQPEDDEDNSQITITPSQIDLELTKSVSTPQVDPSGTVTWTISLLNNADNANADATGVVVTDVLPAGLTLVSNSPSIGSFAGSTWTVGTLAPGASATLTLGTTVDAGVAGGTVLVNTAQVSAANEMDVDSSPGNDGGNQIEDDEDNAQTTVRAVVDLELEKTSDQSSVIVNDAINFTIVVSNNAASANTAATGVTVSDVLAAGTTLVSATPSLGTYDSGTGIWTLGSPLQPGQSATLVIASTVNETLAGQTLVNTAEVTTQDQPDFDSTPGDGLQNDDDDDSAQVNVQLARPMSKRSLLSTSI